MEKSPEIGQLIAALAAASLEFKTIVKDKWNSHFSSNYADLASIRDAVDPALAKQGLRLIQMPTGSGAVVTVLSLLAHKSGEWIIASFSAEAKNGAAQSVGAATTFICRYAVINMLGLALGEDDDGNSTQKDDSENTPDLNSHSNSPEQFTFFDSERDQAELESELKRRNVPKIKWEAIGRWLHGKDRTTNHLSKAIASV